MALEKDTLNRKNLQRETVHKQLYEFRNYMSAIRKK